MSLSRQKIDLDAAHEHLSTLEAWSINPDGKLEKNYEFADFTQAMAFINGVAEHADALDHHPELFNVYNRVDIQLVTHDADGLTEYDFELARRCDEVAQTL